MLTVVPAKNSIGDNSDKGISMFKSVSDNSEKKIEHNRMFHENVPRQFLKSSLL